MRNRVFADNLSYEYLGARVSPESIGSGFVNAVNRFTCTLAHRCLWVFRHFAPLWARHTASTAIAV
jgi:hypothetical protein